MDMQPPSMEYRPTVPTDDAVRCTHVDAALAKVSCAQLGYFEDRFTEMLSKSNRAPHRSPLIHRGYYSRVAAIRQAILRFMKECPADAGVQIVNLGAGLDTIYFWLRDSEERWRDDLVYFEVDFPEVLSRKASAIQKRQNLWPMLDATSAEELLGAVGSSGIRELRTKHCRFVSTDMRINTELADAMTGAGLRGDVPTLFISECVLVYMQAMHGDNIISWAANAVPDAPSAMFVYEQCNPSDRFGKVMVENLMRRGCPLLSIHEYPTMESQNERYTQRGWDQCSLIDMNQVYSKYLDREDVARIQKIELMDEFEEWHLIQAHYFLLIATRVGSEKDASDDGAGSWVHRVAAELSDKGNCITTEPSASNS